jgi:hypothetical protein
MLCFLLVAGTSTAICQRLDFPAKPELFAPGIVSTEKSEIKITFSRDGTCMLWGTIGWEKGKGGWDIWQSQETGTGWGIPRPASFNSEDNDFDPCFSADGRVLYFFSNRPGGVGGDDLYSVSFDAATCSFGEPVNMGPRFNSRGDEWGPSVSKDGAKFIYCTDGFQGKGKHDIMICEREPGGWGSPRNAGLLNSPEDDFDPVFLHDCKTIIFTRKISEDEALLYVSFAGKGGYSAPVLISDTMNVHGAWNLGSSIDPSDSSYIYYSSRIDGNRKGRLDIYRIRYTTTVANE